MTFLYKRFSCVCCANQVSEESIQQPISLSLSLSLSLSFLFFHFPNSVRNQHGIRAIKRFLIGLKLNLVFRRSLFVFLFLYFRFTVEEQQLNENPLNPRQLDERIDSNNPLYLHPSDNPGMILVSKVFDGSSFGTWKRSMLIALSVKNKIGFIDGTVVRPIEGSPDLRDWRRCNDMVTSWLISALNKEVAESVIHSDSALEIWKDLVQHFERSNLVQRFGVRKQFVCDLTGKRRFCHLLLQNQATVGSSQGITDHASSLLWRKPRILQVGRRTEVT